MCEVETMDETAEDLEGVAKRHNSKILYWHVSRLKGSGESRLVPVKIGTGSHLGIGLKRDGPNL
jgi:hypothetical protein